MLGICSLSVLESCMRHCLCLLVYGSETMLWREETSRVRAVQIDNLKGLLGFRRMDRIPNAQIRELEEE